MSHSKIEWKIRNPTEDDFPRMQEICKLVYPFSGPWTTAQLSSHQKIFPNGQLLAVDPSNQNVVGMALSLIVRWDDYSIRDTWKDFTDSGFFTNHDPVHGRTLYGAEVMVDPNYRGQGIGHVLYEARRKLTMDLGLLRIRAGARMRGYGTYANEYTPEEYLLAVLRKQIFDPTISFQVKEGFKVLAVVSDYLGKDPESLGYAALIEWLNPHVAKSEDYEMEKAYFLKTFGEIL